MNKTFEATEIQLIPNPTAMQHTLRGLSATTYADRHGHFHAKMLVGPAGDRALTLLKANGLTRQEALNSLGAKLVKLRQFLNAAEAHYAHGPADV